MVSKHAQVSLVFTVLSVFVAFSADNGTLLNHEAAFREPSSFERNHVLAQEGFSSIVMKLNNIDKIPAEVEPDNQNSYLLNQYVLPVMQKLSSHGCNISRISVEPVLVVGEALSELSFTLESENCSSLSSIRTCHSASEDSIDIDDHSGVIYDQNSVSNKICRKR